MAASIKRQLARELLKLIRDAETKPNQKLRSALIIQDLLAIRPTTVTLLPPLREDEEPASPFRGLDSPLPVLQIEQKQLPAPETTETTETTPPEKSWPNGVKNGS